ncbi:response regulator transcription factor [Robertkochia aurantiaca]|uniref:response regulator transcription factor n=1 Tax=Robertkochia aurantiaca TaxID=2873700 RepID=UPI001CCE3376|nr:response regulator transcription factor [Robertkochia sp. 3YJGBD-33]
MQKNHIILVEDDQALGYLLSEYLKMKHFEVTWVTDGNQALEIIRQKEFDLGILDVMMPGMDGFTLAERIRQEQIELPFIFLTARSLKIDVLKGFSLGAVDYLKKPVDEEELVVRIQTLLKLVKSKTRNAEDDQLSQMGIFDYDAENQILRAEGQELRLTQRENEVLKYLWNRRNQVCSHRDILNTIWGKNDYFNRKSLNVFITRLRKYLEKEERISIDNIHNQGFILSFKED